MVIYKGKRKGRKPYHRLGEPAENRYSHSKAAAQREPWRLATALPVTSGLAKQTVHIYPQRMPIEAGFREVKSHRFGLGLNYHRTHSASRLQVLVLIANWALIVIWLLGCATLLRQPHDQFQANRVRHQRGLSILFIGFQMTLDTRIHLSSDNIHAAWDVLDGLCYEH